MRRLLLVCLASVLLAGCAEEPVHALAGSTSTGFGRAVLMTRNIRHVQTGRVVPLVHVLFVPDWDAPPRSGHGRGDSHGGTVERLTFESVLEDGGRRVSTQPIEVRDTETVHASGRTWSLRNGNVFVALVNPDGTLRVTQLATNETSPAGVLASIKQSLPAEPRVQALEGER